MCVYSCAGVGVCLCVCVCSAVKPFSCGGGCTCCLITTVAAAVISDGAPKYTFWTEAASTVYLGGCEGIKRTGREESLTLTGCPGWVVVDNDVDSSTESAMSQEGDYCLQQDTPPYFRSRRAG